MLRIRVIFGALMAVGIFGLLFLDVYLEDHYSINWAPTFFVVIALVTALAVHELVLLLRQLNWRVYEMPVLAASLAIPASLLAARLHGSAIVWQVGALAVTPVVAVVIGLVMLLLLIETVRGWHRGVDSSALTSLGANLLTFAYVGLLGLALSALRLMETPKGLYALLVSVAVIKSSDIGGYVFGRAFGRTKLVPRLSPRKTVEGLMGGFLLAMVVSLGAGRPLLGLPYWQLAIFALLVTPLAVLGDLAESVIKRAANVKDSGSRVPGFGGVLDVMDSILLASPVAYVLLVLFACGR
ncbi:MAG: phosphatidate cytidylyltransferase [Planctomycetes bacterium]|nr:phosphatidate cytidylyltransferase [Planctomycetota bacterium]